MHVPEVGGRKRWVDMIFFHSRHAWNSQRMKFLKEPFLFDLHITYYRKNLEEFVSWLTINYWSIKVWYYNWLSFGTTAIFVVRESGLCDWHFQHDCLGTGNYCLDILLAMFYRRMCPEEVTWQCGQSIEVLRNLVCFSLAFSDMTVF